MISQANNAILQALMAQYKNGTPNPLATGLKPASGAIGKIIGAPGAAFAASQGLKPAGIRKKKWPFPTGLKQPNIYKAYI